MSTSLTLYSLSSELTDLISLRMEMVEAKEDVTEINIQIGQYLADLPQKVDAVAHVIRHMEAQEQLAIDEVARINARKKQIASERERLESYVKDVLAALPAPKKGKVKKLEGSTATLELWPNGGLQPLDIQDETMVPDEYCEAEIRVPFSFWGKINDLCSEHGVRYKFSGRRIINESAIRAALAESCWDCSGNGGDCVACGGTGKQGVPGVSLRERGLNLRIR